MEDGRVRPAVFFGPAGLHAIAECPAFLHMAYAFSCGKLRRREARAIPSRLFKETPYAIRSSLQPCPRGIGHGGRQRRP